MARRLDFSDHRRELGTNRFVYAVVSRRAQGLSIGINLNPDKVCNFDCPYCQVDRTTPGADAAIDLSVLASELTDLLERVVDGSLWDIAPFESAAPELRRVADIAFAGDGEPTAAPEFAAAANIVRALRDACAAAIPLRLLTNATLLHRSGVAAALPAFDEIWCKLDAGTEEYFHHVDGTTFPFPRILRNLRELATHRPIVIQSMFLTTDGVGPSDEEIAAWVERLREIGPISSVQVYSVARKPSVPTIGPLDLVRLGWIADQARAAGFRADVYG